MSEKPKKKANANRSEKTKKDTTTVVVSLTRQQLEILDRIKHRMSEELGFNVSRSNVLTRAFRKFCADNGAESSEEQMDSTLRV